MSASVFVMSDVVGSTGLWEAHGEHMRVALETHDRLVHGAIEAAGGRVFKHTGDGMIAVFNDADDAVAASIGAVHSLANGSWGPTGALEIRVSVHAGSASERDGDFFGAPVNKTARINGIGHPGQVLVSDVARQLMADPAGLDLGVHQLRDLSEPVRLWQLDKGGHPALRTLHAARHNLPAMPTDFIGRQAEVDALRALIDQHRLVTISGVGGCGKTRLAIEVATVSADQFPGGVWFVDLTTERDGTTVGQRAIRALGLVQQLDSRSTEPVTLLDEAAAGAATLLVIDNCEHLIDDVADFVTDVVTLAASVTVLATSREALNVDGERVWRIPNMHDAAVELFLDRTTAAGISGLEHHHAQIEDICAQLDDIPLAIELAAARLTSLSIGELGERLDERFTLLGGGRSRRRQRQQTLQTMMDWSYGLLNTDERHSLNQLAVFSGTFSLSGVEAVVTSISTPVLDIIDSLVEQSLVVPSVDTGRYRLLETVRIYALDQLINAEEVAATRNRHLAWMVSLSGSERLGSTRAGETWQLEEQKVAEANNAISAMEWAEQSNEHDALLSLYIGGCTYWPAMGTLGLSWTDRVPQPSEHDPYLRSQWLMTSGQILFNAGDEDNGFAQLFEAAEIVDRLADNGVDVSFSLAALLFRGIFHIYTDTPAARADSERLSELQIEGNARYGEWFSLMVRAEIMIWEADPDAQDAVTELEAVGRVVSRFVADNSAATKAIGLSQTGQYEEALEAAMQCLDSEVLGQAVRMNGLVPAVKSLTHLERTEEALVMVEMDFGPTIESQRERLASGQLVSLILILQQLGLNARLDDAFEVARAYAQRSLSADTEARGFLGAVAEDNAPAVAVPPEHPQLTKDRVTNLIIDLIAEIRDHLGAASDTQAVG